MALIDDTYFVGELLIPNLDDSNPVGEANLALLDWFIEKYEKQILIDFLGETLYDEFIAGLATVPIPPKWTALKNQLVDSTNKVSPIACYVYFYYQRNAATQTVGAGEITTATENAVRVTPASKMVRAWNDYVEMMEVVDDWLTENEATYTTWDQDDEYWDNCAHINDFDI